MRYRQYRANLGVNATLVAAGTPAGFDGAFKTVHIGGWAGKVTDNASKTRTLGHGFGFRQNGFLRTPAHLPAFVNGNGAETALAVTATMADD